jgi:hypothetical protein
LARVTVTDRLIAALTSVARRHGALIVQPPDDVTLEQLQHGFRSSKPVSRRGPSCG